MFLVDTFIIYFSLSRLAPNKKSADWQSAHRSAVAKQLTTAARRDAAP
jgi:hypothetical protein